jgi:hypothetical protein
VSKKSALDHGLAVTKAALQLVPFAGGTIASLIDDYVPTSAQRSQEKMLEQFNEKLSTLEGRLDVEAVDKEDFSELLESCSALARRSRREEKLHAAANLLANLFLRPGDSSKVPYEELDHLVRCVDMLSVGAIAVLGAARQVGKQVGQGGGFNFPFLKNYIPEFRKFDDSLLMSFVSELRNFNLLDVHGGAIQLQDFSHVQLRLTPIGQRLVERFIEGKM